MRNNETWKSKRRLFINLYMCEALGSHIGYWSAEGQGGNYCNESRYMGSVIVVGTLRSNHSSLVYLCLSCMFTRYRVHMLVCVASSSRLDSLLAIYIIYMRRIDGRHALGSLENSSTSSLHTVP